ncbi:hypothetical protein SK128_002566, partial [Halocaridina rubra]
ISEDKASLLSKLPTLLKRGNEPSLEEWLSKLTDDNDKVQSSHIDVVEEFNQKYQLSSQLKSYSSLPPSLIPPMAQSLIVCDFQEWG